MNIYKRKAMNKKIMRVMLAISFLGSSYSNAATSQFRTPLTMEYRGSLHYPLQDVEEAWWYGQTGCERKPEAWHFEGFSVGYGRSANKSFFNECDPCDNKVTRDKVSLSQLFFGKEAFRGEDAFPGGFIAGTELSPDNIALGFSRITPRFEYNEYGVILGGCADWRLGKGGHGHLRFSASLPIKLIEIELDQTCKYFETMDDVVEMRMIVDDNAEEGTNLDFAARLDFLTSLILATTPNGAIAPFVQQVPLPTIPPSEAITIGGNLASGTVSTDAQVYLRESATGTIPSYPFRVVQATSTAQALPADGTLADGGTAFFLQGTDYSSLLLDKTAQGTLFVVPASVSPDNNALVSGAISTALFNKLDTLTVGGDIKSPFDIFLESCGINFCKAERITGQGDLTTYITGGYLDDGWFIDGIFGVSWPTGTKTDDVTRVYLQSTGNNHHYEAKLGVDGGWRVREWFAFEIYAMYHHAFKRTEQRAAPFTGATVKNIGPAVGVDVSWDYVNAYASLNFFHPCNPELGAMIAYDFFAKSKDRVCTKCPAPADCLGRENSSLPAAVQGLDPEILEKNTNSLTHKIRTEIFHRWNFFELFAGGSQVLAGRNAMQESEAYLGMTVYF